MKRQPRLTKSQRKAIERAQVQVERMRREAAEAAALKAGPPRRGHYAAGQPGSDSHFIPEAP